MKYILPVFIAIVTLVGVLFVAFNQKPWEEMSKRQKTFIVSTLVVGVIALAIGSVAFFFL